jgi:ABC-type transport system involved in cytochrome bd biosynthesis fused ATPase/permease subunit
MSALHHACGTVSMLYECNQGTLMPEGEEIQEWQTISTYDEILMQLYILFEQTIRYAHELRDKGVM